MRSFTDTLAARGVLLADGAIGTNFQDRGIEPGVPPEEWVFDAPDNFTRATERLVVAQQALSTSTPPPARSIERTEKVLLELRP